MEDGALKFVGLLAGIALLQFAIYPWIGGKWSKINKARLWDDAKVLLTIVAVIGLILLVIYNMGKSGSSEPACFNQRYDSC